MYIKLCESQNTPYTIYSIQTTAIINKQKRGLPSLQGRLLPDSIGAQALGDPGIEFLAWEWMESNWKYRMTKYSPIIVAICSQLSDSQISVSRFVILFDANSLSVY